MASSEDASTSTQKSEVPDEGSWWSSWGKSIIDSVKEKTSSTVEMVHKDLSEFYQTIQSDTAVAVVDTAGMVQDKMKVSKDDEDTAKGSFKHGISSILSSVSESLKTLTQEEPAEPTSKVENTFSSPIYDRRKMKIQAIQSDVSTYCNEPEGLKEAFVSWKEMFDFDSKRAEMSDLLVKNPEIRAIYSRLVPTVVSHSTFWLRYFYKIHQYKEEEERRAALVARADSNNLQEQDYNWDSDDGEECIHAQPMSTNDASLIEKSSAEIDTKKEAQIKDQSSKTVDDFTEDDKGEVVVDAGDKKGDDVVDAGDEKGDDVVDAGDKKGDDVVDAGDKKDDDVVDAGDKKGDDIDIAGDKVASVTEREVGEKDSTRELESFDEHPDFSASVDGLDSQAKENAVDHDCLRGSSFTSSPGKEGSSSSSSSVEVIHASDFDFASHHDKCSTDVAKSCTDQSLVSNRTDQKSKSKLVDPVNLLAASSFHDQSETSSTGSWISVDDEIRVRRLKKDQIADPACVGIADKENTDSKRNSGSSNSSAVIVEKSECKQSDDEDNEDDDFDLDEDLNDEELQKIMQKISDKSGDLDDDDDWEDWE